MKLLQRIGVFLFFLACGLLVFVVFSHYYFPLFERPADTIGRVVTAIVFLVAALIARRSKRFNQYWLILFSFFAALPQLALTVISVSVN